MTYKSLQIDGWTFPEELDWLRVAAKGKNELLEIGSWKGRSTMALYEGLDDHAKLYCVDTWRGSDNEAIHDVAKTKNDPIYKEFIENHNEGIAKGKIKVFRSRSVVALLLFARNNVKFDFIFIDGDHSYSATKADIEGSLKVLNTNGVLCGHDWGLDLHNDGGPQKAAMEYGGYSIGVGSLWVLK